VGLIGGGVGCEASGEFDLIAFLRNDIAGRVDHAGGIELSCVPRWPEDTQVDAALPEPHASTVQLRVADQRGDHPRVLGRIGVLWKVHPPGVGGFAGVGLGWLGGVAASCRDKKHNQTKGGDGSVGIADAVHGDDYLAGETGIVSRSRSGSTRAVFSVTPVPYLVHQYRKSRRTDMRIDCDECAMQHTVTCNDCVVAVLLRESDGPLEIDTAESVALSAMADAGLVPRLRLVRHDEDLEAAG